MSRVEAARDGQDEAKAEFADALEQFRSVVELDGGELEERYDGLRAAYEDAEARARDVRKRIDAVDSVGSALFDEWEDEIEGDVSRSMRDMERSIAEADAFIGELGSS